MTENPYRPTVRLDENGARYFDEAPVLLSRLTVVMAVYDTQTRAELWQWTPDDRPTGRLKWQHHAPIPASGPEVAGACSSYLATTVEYLAARGWPGIDF